MSNFNAETIRTHFIKCHEYEWSHYYLVTGTGGVRTDFVTGWLETIKEYFVDIQDPKPDAWWTIDPVTGASQLRRDQLYNHNLIPIHKLYESPITDEITSIFARYYNPDAKGAISKSHIVPRVLDQYIPEDFKQHFTVIHILSPTDLDLKLKVTWEFVLKTYLKSNRSNNDRLLSKMQQLSAEYSVPASDSIEIQQKQTLETIITLLAKKVQGDTDDILDNQQYKFKVVNIPYEEVIKPTGGEYIANALNFTRVPEQSFELYKRAMSLVDSPNEIIKYNQLWSFQRFKNVATGVTDRY